MTASDEINETLNVGGTRTALGAGRRARGGVFHQVSSVAASGDYRGVFDESMFDEGQRLPSAYHRTKFESEKIVREESAVPWRVYRPAVVVGHSETGAMDKIDGPYYFFPLFKRMRDTLPAWLPLVGVDLGDTNVVPVDYVAKAMDHLAHQPGLDGAGLPPGQPGAAATVELVNTFAAAAKAPQFAVPVDRRVTACCPTSLLPRALRPADLRAAALRTAARAPRAHQTIGRLGIPPEVLEHVSFPSVYASSRTEKALAGSGIAVPDLESYAAHPVVVLGGDARRLDHRRRRRRPSRRSQGKTVVITGASSGIGLVTAVQVAKAGGVPILVARGKDKLEATKAAIESQGGTAYAYPCDLSDLHAIDALTKQLCRGLRAHRLRGQQRRPLDPALAEAQRGPVPRLRAHHAAQLLRRDPAGDGPAAEDARAEVRPRRERLLDRGAHQPAPVLAYVASKAALDAWSNVVSRRAGRRRRLVHQHPHAAGAHADDRADQDVRPVPGDHPRRRPRQGDHGAGRPAARDQHQDRQPRRARPHAGAEGRLPGPARGLPGLPGLARPRAGDPRTRTERARASRRCWPGCSRASTGDPSL